KNFHRDVDFRIQGTACRMEASGAKTHTITTLTTHHFTTHPSLGVCTRRETSFFSTSMKPCSILKVVTSPLDCLISTFPLPSADTIGAWFSRIWNFPLMPGTETASISPENNCSSGVNTSSTIY